MAEPSSQITASVVARFLDVELHGPDVTLSRAASLGSVTHGALVFATDFDEGIIEQLNRCRELMALVPHGYAGRLRCSHVLVDNPRLAFARALTEFFALKPKPGIAPTARVSNNVSLGQNVTIGEYSVVRDGAVIGDRTEIRHHVVIAEAVRVGHNCLIRSNSVIGEEGFGFAFAENGEPVRIPHLGSVVIGNHVEIGAVSTVARGTLDPTVICDYVKINDHVLIGHNVRIGRNTIVNTCAMICGSTRVGDDVWVGPNASITNGISVGDGSFITMGSVVTRDVPPGEKVSGNFAIPHAKFLEFIRKIR